MEKFLGRGGAPAAPAYRATVRCHNRFCEGGVLEVVSPHEPIRALEVRGLCLLHEEEGAEPWLEKVPVANRSMDRYVFEAPFELREHDLLRARKEPKGA